MTTLIDPAALDGRLRDPDLIVVDCRFSLKDRDRGHREYLASHIPGAVYADLERDLSGPATGTNGRHPPPDPHILARTLGRLGIDRSTQVVAYDQDDGAFASRLWWSLRWLGHETVAVLDGGLTRWVAEGHATASGEDTREPRTFAGTPRPELMADADEIARLLGRGGAVIVDARAPERYRGEVEPIDRVAGHIPGAVNHPFKTNVDAAGRFRSVDELREHLRRTIGSSPPERVICYCGSGVTACQNVLAFEHAGYHGVRLYPGSWSEWSSDPSRPVERSASSGPAPSGRLVDRAGPIVPEQP